MININNWFEERTGLTPLNLKNLIELFSERGYRGRVSVHFKATAPNAVQDFHHAMRLPGVPSFQHPEDLWRDPSLIPKVPFVVKVPRSSGNGASVGGAAKNQHAVKDAGLMVFLSCYIESAKKPGRLRSNFISFNEAAVYSSDFCFMQRDSGLFDLVRIGHSVYPNGPLGYLI